jgi:hypothetical protein
MEQRTCGLKRGPIHMTFSMTGQENATSKYR